MRKNYGGYCQTRPNVQWSDFLTCAITFQHQWRLSSALDWGNTCSSLQGSSPRHVNATGHEVTSLLQQAVDATHARTPTQECRSTQVVTIVEGQTEGWRLTSYRLKTEAAMKIRWLGFNTDQSHSWLLLLNQGSFGNRFLAPVGWFFL